MNKVKRIAALFMATALILATLSGCTTTKSGYKKNAKLNAEESVEIIIAGRNRDFKAMEIVAQKFTEIYPNCHVEYEYLQNFDVTLPKRVATSEDRVDLFMSNNIQDNSVEYALDLLDYVEQVPLTDTLSGLVENFKYVESDSVTHLYAVPTGGELRGLFVNTTLLNKLGIAIPTNVTELLAACEKLREAGYIALQDNPGSFGQRFVFPYIANLISKADDAEGVRKLFETCSDDAAEMIREAIKLVYDVTVSGYYNYKYVETVDKNFLDLSDEGLAKSFLGITEGDDSITRAENVGIIPFMAAADSLMPVIDKIKEDYHSEIEYEFILAPVTEEGGIAYMSPCSGIAVNKYSEHLDWALEFMNFFFSADTNKLFAEENNITSNTFDALEIISEKYGISVDMISQPGDIKFDYNLFNLVLPTLVSVAKVNNPKYMESDGNGGYTPYPFEKYMDMLKDAFRKQREAK